MRRECPGYATGMGIDRRWVQLAAVLSVGITVAAVVVPVLLTRTGGEAGDPSPGGSDRSGDAAGRPSDQRPGVPVGGQGTLLREASGSIRFCASVAVTLDMPTSSASCDRVAVATSG